MSLGHEVVPAELRTAEDGEDATRKPLVLRGHHLLNLYEHIYWTYWGGQESIAEFAKASAKAIKEDYNNFPGYTEDVLGKNHEHEAKFLADTEDVVRRFMELPDDYPLEIVEGIPDDICKACAVGAHCRTFGDGRLFGEDRKWMDWIVPFSQEMSNTNPTLEVTKEVASFSDAGPVEVRRVKTTVGMIRNALPHFLY